MNLFTRLRNESSTVVSIIVRKTFFSFFLFFSQREDVIFITCRRSLASPACTSDFDRTLCYYRTVRTLYYLFPTQPCIESQKVTRFHVTQLCRRSFLQKFQMLNLSNARNISSHLRLKYSIQRDAYRCIFVENEETIDVGYISEERVLRSTTLHCDFLLAEFLSKVNISS